MSSKRSRLRPSVWEGLQVALISVNFGWTTFCLGGALPETMVVTSALTAALLVVHLAGRAWGAHASPDQPNRAAKNGDEGRSSGETAPTFVSRRIHPAGWWLLPFLAFAAINVLKFTPIPWLGWEDWLGWAQMIAVFWVVLNGVRTSTARATLLGALLVVTVTATLMACYQRLADPGWMVLGHRQASQFLGRAGGPFGNPNSLAALLLLLIPLSGALTFRPGRSAVYRVGWGSVTALLVIGLILTISRGAWLGLALALTAWPLVAGGWRWPWRLAGAILVVGLLAALALTLHSTLPTVRERMDRLAADMGEKSRPVLWRAAWTLFQEHPVVGSGAGSFPAYFETYRPEYFQTDPHWAHNDYLNTLSDYGSVGFSLFFGAGAIIVGLCWSSARRAEPDRRSDLYLARALAIGLLAFAFHLFVDFHLKLPALAMAFAVVAALAVQRARPLRPRLGKLDVWPRITSGICAAGVTLGALLWVVPHYRAEAVRYTLRGQLDRSARETVEQESLRQLVERAVTSFTRSTEIDPTNSQAWADRAYALALMGQYEPARVVERGREAETYARRALSGSVVIAEFWLRLGVALDMQGRWVEAGSAFAEALRLAPTRADSWFYHAYHIALRTDLYEMRLIALSEVATSLRLDPRIRDAEALRQRLMANH